MGLGSGYLEIFLFRLLNKKKDSGIIGLVRPAGGHKISLKLVNYDVKWTNIGGVGYRGSLYEHFLPGSLI